MTMKLSPSLTIHATYLIPQIVRLQDNVIRSMLVRSVFDKIVR